MEFENILYEVRDGILYLTLNRPEVRNALSPEMWRDISAAVRQARLDDARSGGGGHRGRGQSPC